MKAGLERVNSLLKETNQGYGWKCEPGLGTGFRGPGRKDDICPMAVVDALRGYWALPGDERPENLVGAGKTLLGCWTARSEHKPYMFGHGRNFRRPRPPFFWYNVGTVLDATSHYPELVGTRAFRELLAVARLAFRPDGTVVPGSIYTFFKGFSFGQKRESSPWETLFLARVFKRAADADPGIVEAVKAIDGSSLKGSKGGPGTKKKAKKKAKKKKKGKKRAKKKAKKKAKKRAKKKAKKKSSSKKRSSTE
ncbi:MAG: hypothetical protein ACTSU5_16710 [Promethearchaeota archaeon]